MTTLETFFRRRHGMTEGRLVVERIGGKHPRFEVTVYAFRINRRRGSSLSLIPTVFGIAPTLRSALIKARHNLWTVLAERERLERMRRL